MMVGLLPLVVARPFVGILLWSWLSFMNPHQLTWGFASGMPWAMLVFCATLLGCVVAREPRRLAVNGVTMLLALFLVCITITSLAAIVPPERVWEKWEWAAKILLGLLLTAALLDDRRRLHALIWLMAIAIGYFGVKGGLFTLMTGGSYIVLGPPNSIIGDRNHLAAAVLIAIPLMNYLRLQSRHRAVRIGLAGAIIASLFAVVGSQSRGALLGLIAAAGVMWIRSPRKIVSGTMIVAALAAALYFMPESWWERMQSIESYAEDASAMGRLQIWMASWQIAVNLPFTGGGFYSMYTRSVLDQFAPGTGPLAAHSIWFEVLGEHGFPTFFVWFGIVVAGGIYTMRILRLAKGRSDLAWAANLARMAQVSIVAYLSAGSLLSLAYWDFFWTLMVVLAAAHRLAAEQVQARPATDTGQGVAPLAAGWRQRTAGVVQGSAGSKA
jgi:probable O-glycosylation ligase (exosortase A-associated)